MVRITIVGIAVVLAGTAAAAQQADDAQVKARQRIAMMEGTLESAVKIGADNLLRQVKAAVPDPPMLTGAPEVHGFRLDGYGIFFDVGVPMLRLPVTWPLRYMINSDNRDLEILATELKAADGADGRAISAAVRAGRPTARVACPGPGSGCAASGRDCGGQPGAGRSTGR